MTPDQITRMTPLAQSIFEQATEVNRVATDSYRQGYEAGWAAAMAAKVRKPFAPCAFCGCTDDFSRALDSRICAPCWNGGRRLPAEREEARA